MVEDDPGTLAALRLILNRLGHSVLAAATLQEGMTLAAQGEFDCAVLDLMLPDGDGSDILRYIRSISETIPVAVTTGAGDPRTLRAAEALRPSILLTKPIDLKALITALKLG